MASKKEHLKLGAFVMVGLALLLGGLLALVGVEALTEQVRYHLLVKGSVHGLSEGAPVEIRGVRVGSVERIELFPEEAEGRVRVTLAVKPDIPIHHGSTAFLRFQGVGVSGRRYVELEGGDPGEPTHEAGSRLPVGETVFERLSDRLEQMTASGERLMTRTATLVASLNRIARSVDERRVAEMLKRSESLMARLDGAAQQLRAILRENRGTVRQTVDNVGDASEDAERVMARAEETLARVDTLVRRLEGTVQTNRDEVRATIDNLRDATREFETLGRRLREDPSRLLLAEPPEPREIDR